MRDRGPPPPPGKRRPRAPRGGPEFARKSGKIVAERKQVAWHGHSQEVGAPGSRVSFACASQPGGAFVGFFFFAPLRAPSNPFARGEG